MDKSIMLEQLINYYTDGNKAKFSEMIGIKPQLLSNWVKRKTFDAELLYKGCRDVSADWILSGEGEMIKSKQNEYKDVRQDNELLTLLDKQRRSTKVVVELDVTHDEFIKMGLKEKVIQILNK